MEALLIGCACERAYGMVVKPVDLKRRYVDVAVQCDDDDGILLDRKGAERLHQWLGEWLKKGNEDGK